MNSETLLRKSAIILFWLAVWQAGSMVIGNSIIFVGPFDMAKSLAVQLPSMDFWKTIAYSFSKISLGFLSAFMLGILLGSGGYHIPLLRELLEPVVLLMKSIPVASFVILALIWIGSRQLSVFISFLVVFPIIYVNTIAGLESTDEKLLEMAQVFRISGWKRVRFIYLPALLPYLISGCKVALGLSWKSGIAAEVIGVPASSIGEKLYMAKIYLSTADLFAWTFVVIVVSAVFEHVFLLLLSAPQTLAPKRGCLRGHTSLARREEAVIKPKISRLSKSFGELPVLHKVSMELESGHIYCLMGASGSGKTTLLRILLGLERQDAGEVNGLEHSRMAAVFQEDRLCEGFTPLDNVLLAAGRDLTPSMARAELCKLLPEESLSRPVYTLSGGMKRRTAVCRALLADSDVVLMDEPFTGLDEETKHRVIEYIKEMTVGKLLLISTHQEEDIALLGGELVTLDSDGTNGI